MKSVCPVKVKINWRSGGGYRGNQPVPVVFKLGVLATRCFSLSNSRFLLFLIRFPLIINRHFINCLPFFLSKIHVVLSGAERWYDFTFGSFQFYQRNEPVAGTMRRATGVIK